MAENLDFINPFRTDSFGYTRDSIVDIEIQPVYDGSVNIILVSAGTHPRIVNSRQRFDKTTAEIVVRGGDNFDNVYDNQTVEKTALLPSLSSVIPILEFNGVLKESGNLLSGGYKYYFKLKTADGLESPIIEESRLVSIHQGSEYGKALSFITDKYVSNAVQFTITNIDTKVYKYVSVYYTRAVGQTENTVKTAHRINKDYDITDITTDLIGQCKIVHTGFEGDAAVDISEITASYSPIDSASTITQKNNRLLLGNIKTFDTVDSLLQTAALKCYIRQTLDAKLYTEQIIYEGNAVIDDTYANPTNIYKKLGYFPGETYEFAINFVFNNGTVSPAYPIMGMDWYQYGATFTNFDSTKLGQDIGWLSSGQNSKGVVRLPYKTLAESFTQTVPTGSSLSKMDAHSVNIDTTKMVSEDLQALQSIGVISYFVSRKKRVPNLIMYGLTTLAATAMISTMYPKDMCVYTFGMFSGYGLQGTFADKLILFPIPGNAIPLSTERLDVTTGNDSNYFWDGVQYAPLADRSLNKYYALYSPDITCDTASAAVINTVPDYSIVIESNLTQNIAYKTSRLLSHYTGTNGTRYSWSANPYRLSTLNQSTYKYNINKLSYVDDGMRAFTSFNFAGRLDRQMAMAVYTVLRPYAEKGNMTGACDVVKPSNQYAFWDYQCHYAPYYDYYYKAHNSTTGEYAPGTHCGGGGFPWDDDPPQILMSGVKYSPYIGLVIENSSNLSTALDMSQTGTSAQAYLNIYEQEGSMIPAKGANIMGAITRMFNTTGGPLTRTNWITKYSIRRGDPYFAVTRRFSIADIISPNTDQAGTWYSYLSGGDCYSGIYYQRVWRPGGIEGSPTANNPSKYSSEGETVTRNGVNITNSGYAIGFPVRSKFNFAVRALEESDETEMLLYGKHRTYCSSYPISECHGNRQAETSVINYGNMIEDSVLEYPEFDPKIPYIELKYDNRIVISNVSEAGEFVNGYRDFRGFNYKDYDTEKGPITALASTGLYTYVVYTGGVSLIEVSERSAVTNQETGVNVYTASADVLPPKSTPIFTDIGSQHLQSVVLTEATVYGVDVNTRKIWAVSGADKEVISDFKFQSVLNSLITDELVNIKGSYDVVFNEVTFTFIYNKYVDSHAVVASVSGSGTEFDVDAVGDLVIGSVIQLASGKATITDITELTVTIDTALDFVMDEVIKVLSLTDDIQKSILYNVVQKVWCGTTDMHKIYQFSVENKMYSLQKPEDKTVYSLFYPVLNQGSDPWFKQVGKTTAVDAHNGTDLVTNYKDVYTSYIEFVIKDENLLKFNLSNIIINGNGVPSEIHVMAESINEYTVEPSDLNVSGVLQDTIPIHTNIYMRDAVEADLSFIDEYRFTRIYRDEYKDLRIGDKITIELIGEGDTHVFQQFTIANVTTANGIDTVVLSNPMSGDTTMAAMYYGWKVPLRISLGENMGGKVKLTIPSRKQANLIKNVTNTAQNNYVNYAISKPYGRWIKLRLYFEGIDQIFIESIMSESTIRYT